VLLPERMERVHALSSGGRWWEESALGPLSEDEIRWFGVTGSGGLDLAWCVRW
jgi:hypothetical protein